MPLLAAGIPEFNYFRDSPPTIVGDLGASGLNPNIRVFKDGIEMPLTSSGTTQIGNTSTYAWSAGHLPIIGSTVEQYYWIMKDGSAEDDGQFILKTLDVGIMPRDNSTILIQQP